MYKIVINSQRNSNQSKITALIAKHPYKLFFCSSKFSFCLPLHRAVHECRQQRVTWHAAVPAGDGRGEERNRLRVVSLSGWEEQSEWVNLILPYSVVSWACCAFEDSPRNNITVSRNTSVGTWEIFLLLMRPPKHDFYSWKWANLKS